MRLLCSLVALLCASGTAFADTAISLAPLQGEKNLDVVTTRSFTGSCGSSIVEVMGVTDIVDNFYSVDLDAGKVIVRSAAGKEFSIDSSSGVLSDHNGVACVATRSGKRLLFWSNCSGSACGDNFSFFVFDPQRLVFLAPQNPRKGQCDAGCASRLLGSKLPQKINGQ